MLMEHSDNETTNHCATKTWNCWSMWNVENEMMRKWYTKSCLVLSWKLMLNDQNWNEVYEQDKWSIQINRWMKSIKYAKKRSGIKSSSLM